MDSSHFICIFGGVLFGGLVANLVHVLHPNGLRTTLANSRASTTRHTHRLLIQLEETTGLLADGLRRREGASHDRQRTAALSKLGELLAFCDPDAFLRGSVAPWNLYARSFDDAFNSIKCMATGSRELDTALLNVANEMSANSVLNAVVAAAV